MTIQKWGGLASFLLAVTFIVSPLIYLTGDLRDLMGLVAYDLADFLNGPVWAASLVTVVLALRERFGEHAPRRMNLALMAAMIAAAAMISVAFIRSANRHYHINHPELNLEMSTQVLVVWTALVAGVTAVGWHFLGWVLVLLASASWTTRSLPRALSLLYLAAGVGLVIRLSGSEFRGDGHHIGVGLVHLAGDPVMERQVRKKRMSRNLGDALKAHHRAIPGHAFEPGGLVNNPWLQTGCESAWLVSMSACSGRFTPGCLTGCELRLPA